MLSRLDALHKSDYTPLPGFKDVSSPEAVDSSRTTRQYRPPGLINDRGCSAWRSSADRIPQFAP